MVRDELVVAAVTSGRARRHRDERRAWEQVVRTALLSNRKRQRGVSDKKRTFKPTETLHTKMDSRF